MPSYTQVKVTGPDRGASIGERHEVDSVCEAIMGCRVCLDANPAVVRIEREVGHWVTFFNGYDKDGVLIDCFVAEPD